MSGYTYFAEIVADPDGGYLVTFPDVPEAITHGEDLEDAKASASEALGLALRGYVADEQDLPQPETREGVEITVGLEDALKLALVQAFKQSGLTKTELARRMGKSENEERRLLNPDHSSKVSTIQDALRALNKTVKIQISEAA